MNHKAQRPPQHATRTNGASAEPLEAHDVKERETKKKENRAQKVRTDFLPQYVLCFACFVFHFFLAARVIMFTVGPGFSRFPGH